MTKKQWINFIVVLLGFAYIVFMLWNIIREEKENAMREDMIREFIQQRPDIFAPKVEPIEYYEGKG